MTQLYALIPSVSIDALMMRREGLIDQLNLVRDHYVKLHDLRVLLFGGENPTALDYDLTLTWNRTHREFDQEMDLAVKRIDAACWAFLLDKSGLRQMMDQKQRKEWDDQLSKLEMPPFSRENITATFERLAQSRDEIFERGVVNVFRGLSWDYKTNSPVKFGRRMIQRYAAERFVFYDKKAGKQGTALYGPRHEFAGKLDDLIRAFCVLEGKPEPSYEQGAYHTLRRNEWMQGEHLAGDESFKPEEMVLHGYLRFRGYKNGNAHITFLRSDLVDQLNRIVAKHYPQALPPADEPS